MLFYNNHNNYYKINNLLKLINFGLKVIKMNK